MSLKFLNFILLLQFVTLHFMGFEAHNLCTAHKLNFHRNSYLEGNITVVDEIKRETLYVRVMLERKVLKNFVVESTSNHTS